MEMTEFIEGKMNKYAVAIASGGARVDDHALGELTFYAALRRVSTGHATAQDLGLMDAINDVLQEKGLIATGRTFYK